MGTVCQKREPTRNVSDHALQALFPLPRGPRPTRELLRKFRSLGLLPPLFPALQVGRIRGGGSQGAPGVVSRGASSPPARPRSSEMGGGVSLDVRPWRASALLSLLPLRELERGRLLVRDGFPLPAPLPRLLLPAHRSTLRDVMSREKFQRTAPLLDPPVFPDLRIKEQGKIAELALGRTALVTVAVVLALAPLPVRGQAVESVGGGHPLGLCPPASGRDLRIAPTLGACALVLVSGRLVLLFAVGRNPIGRILSLQMMTEPRLLLPELDVHLEVLLAIFAPLRRVTACRVLALRVGRRCHPRERTIIAQVLVVDPTRLRVERMMVDFDRDDSFRSVLGLIRNFHAMEEPAGTPSARCKTSLASIYGLMPETSPAFHLPVSPLVRSLLDDTNLALSKFLEDQTVHGFLPYPVAVIAGTSVPPLPLFRDRTQSLPV